MRRLLRAVERVNAWLDECECAHPIGIPFLFFVFVIAVGVALYVVATA